MSEMVKFVINGKKIEVKEGTTLLEAARSLGIDIPTLCYHEALGPYGACRVCLVEIIYSGRSKLTTACTYPAWEGLEVNTDSEKVRAARKFALELLLARSPNVGEIKELAKKLGVKPGRLKANDDDCILCGLCVRVCRDMIGKSAISFVSRGVERKVETPFEERSGDCIGCGACAFLCPTGAIRIEDVDKVRKMQRCRSELELAKCKGCGSSFVPLKELEYIRKKIDLPKDIFEICQNCRRSALRTQLSAIKKKRS